MLTSGLIALFLTSVLPPCVLGMGPEDFQDPTTVDFDELAYGTHLGTGLPNPYEALGVEFTGYVADSDYGDLDGHHLATGFANTPPEPYVVRIRFLDRPALRVGGYVWPEYECATSITAFDDTGAVLDSFSVDGGGTPFMGLESSVDSPIWSVEWQGGAGASLSTFPRVDNVMVDFTPEPATLSLIALGGTAVLAWRRRHAKKDKGPGSARFVNGLAFLLVVSATGQAWADMWFLGIGNDGYTRDVEGLYGALTADPTWCPPQPVRSLLRSNRTETQVRDDLDWLTRSPRPGDMAMFFYSGHGVSDTYDWNDDEPLFDYDDERIGLQGSHTGLTDDELTECLWGLDDRVPVVIILDTCHAGGFVDGHTDLIRLPNAYCLLSCRAHEGSRGGYPYSEFTTHLIDGISGGRPADGDGNGIVTLDEWFLFARRGTRGQTPVKYDSGGLGGLPVVAPEPATMAFLVLGTGVLLARRIPQRTAA